MPGADQSLRLRSWLGHELLPPVIQWMAEGTKFNASSIQNRSLRAVAIGEIDEHVHAFVMMRTGEIMRWLWHEAADVASDISAWIEPGGQVHRFAYGGHYEWITQNLQRLLSEGFPQPEAGSKGLAAISEQMMKRGWIRYSGGAVVTFPAPNEAQTQALDALLREISPPPDYRIQFMIVGLGVMADVAAKDVMDKGSATVLSELATGAPVDLGEEPLAPHKPKTADAGGGTSGPFQQGDGQEVQHSFMETVQDGSTAPFDKAYHYLTQDWEPEVWWSRNLLDYLKKQYPGKKDVSGPEPDSGSIPSATGPGQQFAVAVSKIVAIAARRVVADATDPSDTDPQHGQLEQSMEARLVDPDSFLYKRDKGRGRPFGGDGSGDGELRTRLGDLWRQRRSDKAVEQVIIDKEKELKEPAKIRQELREDGVPPSIIDETYENRDRQLFKVVGG